MIRPGGRPPTLDALLDGLADDGVVDEPQRRAAEQEAAQLLEEDGSDPWYLQALAGMGAWVAAAFVVAFLACSGLIDLDGSFPYFWSTVFIAIGVIVQRWRGDQGVFSHQLSLACSLVGQGLLIGGSAEQFGIATAFGVYTGAAVVLFFLFPTMIHRFLMAFGSMSLAAAAINDLNIESTYAGLFAVEMALVCATFSEDRWLPARLKLALRPLGYAAAMSLIWISSDFFLREFAGLANTWAYRGIAAAGLVFLVYQASRHASRRSMGPAAWGAGATVALAVVSTPGIIVSLTIIFVGLWRQARSMLTLGVLALGYYLFAFYYSMKLDLWSKSFVLIASGAVLLALRWWFARNPWFEPAEGAE